MVKELDHFLDTFISVIILSIPIFLLALSLWAQGFSFVTNDQKQTLYLDKSTFNAFILQTVLIIGSLIFAIVSRISENIENKKIFLKLTLILYIFSIVAFMVVINSLRVI